MEFVVFDSTGDIVWSSIERYRRLYAPEVEFTSGWDVILPDDAERVRADLAMVMMTRQPRVVRVGVRFGPIAQGRVLARLEWVKPGLVVGTWHWLPDDELTTRERQVLEAIVSDESVIETCQRLGISRSTYDSHRQRLLRRTHTDGTAGLVRWAIRHGVSDDRRQGGTTPPLDDLESPQQPQ